jgi:hypothetical protein
MYIYKGRPVKISVNIAFLFYKVIMVEMDIASILQASELQELDEVW